MPLPPSTATPPVNPEPLCQKEEMNIIFNAFIDEKNIWKSPNVCDDGLETDFNDHSSDFEDQGWNENDIIVKLYNWKP